MHVPCIPALQGVFHEKPLLTILIIALAASLLLHRVKKKNKADIFSHPLPPGLLSNSLKTDSLPVLKLS
jgi:hypothetical protein